MSSVLNTLAKPATLPPNSSSPDVGGIDTSTFSKFPGLNVSAVVSTYNPPGLTLTVHPAWDCSACEPTLRHDTSNFNPNRLYLRLSGRSIMRVHA